MVIICIRTHTHTGLLVLTLFTGRGLVVVGWLGGVGISPLAVGGVFVS